MILGFYFVKVIKLRKNKLVVELLSFISGNKTKYRQELHLFFSSVCSDGFNDGGPGL